MPFYKMLQEIYHEIGVYWMYFACKYIYMCTIRFNELTGAWQNS